MESEARALRSGQITRACLDNGMGAPDARETAAVLLPVLDAMLAEAWDDGHDCCTYPVCRDNPYSADLSGEGR